MLEAGVGKAGESVIVLALSKIFLVTRYLQLPI